MTLNQPMLRLSFLTGLLLAIGAVGGFVALKIHLPMPWMLGSLIVSGLIVLLIRPASLEGYGFPQKFRTFFVALIGVMIGTQVTPELLALASELPLTMAALAAFVMLAHSGNYLIFRHFGKYDRPTAFYSAAPGGLMESIVLGEAAKADARILTAQQFLRIIFVITLFPLGLSLWLGHPVGSSAGMTGGTAAIGPVSLTTVGFIVAAAVLGLGLGKLIHLPAGILTGPLLVAAVATISGVIDLHLPLWMIASAQLVIGVSLGLRFQGTDGALLKRSAGMSLLSVSYMLLLGGLFAWGLHLATGIEALHLMISFAPGGLAEMSIIALSLAANPAFVSLHHVARILMTVVELTVASKWLNLR